MCFPQDQGSQVEEVQKVELTREEKRQLLKDKIKEKEKERKGQ